MISDLSRVLMSPPSPQVQEGFETKTALLTFQSTVEPASGSHLGYHLSGVLGCCPGLSVPYTQQKLYTVIGLLDVSYCFPKTIQTQPQ